MNKNALVKELLDNLCKVTTVLRIGTPEYGDAKTVVVPSKRINGKPFPIYLIEKDGNFIATDMGFLFSEINSLNAEEIEKISQFAISKLETHELILDENKFIHTNVSAIAKEAINALLAFATVVYFALDAAISS